MVSTAPAQTEIFGVTRRRVRGHAPRRRSRSRRTPTRDVQVPALARVRQHAQRGALRLDRHHVSPTRSSRCAAERRSADLIHERHRRVPGLRHGRRAGQREQRRGDRSSRRRSTSTLFVWEGDLTRVTASSRSSPSGRRSTGSRRVGPARADRHARSRRRRAWTRSVAYDPVRQRVMVAYVKQDPALDGSEIFVRRFNAGLDAVRGRAASVSRSGPTGRDELHSRASRA